MCLLHFAVTYGCTPYTLHRLDVSDLLELRVNQMDVARTDAFWLFSLFFSFLD